MKLSRPRGSSHARRLRAGFAAMLAVGLLAAACGSSKGSGSSSSTTSGQAPGSTAASAAAPMKVKVLFDHSVTGPTAAIAPDITLATKLATEDLKKEGLELDVSSFDPQADPQRAVSGYRDGVKSGPLAVVGNLTNTAAAIAPLANKDEVPFLGTTVALTDVAIKNRPWAFMVGGDITAITKRGMTAWLGYKPNLKKIVAIADVKNVSTKGQAESALAAAGPKAGEVVGFETGATDFAALVRRAIAQNADGIVVGSLPGDTGSILKEVRAQGSTASIFIIQAAFSPEVLKAKGPALDGAFVVGQWFNGLSNPETVEYVKRFTAQSNGELPVYSLVYEGWMALGHAMLSVPGLSKMDTKEARQAVRDALVKTEFSALDGSKHLKFNDKGFVDRKGVLTQLSADGKMTAMDMGA